MTWAHCTFTCTHQTLGSLHIYMHWLTAHLHAHIRHLAHCTFTCTCIAETQPHAAYAAITNGNLSHHSKHPGPLSPPGNHNTDLLCIGRSPPIDNERDRTHCYSARHSQYPPVFHDATGSGEGCIKLVDYPPLQ